jgi:ribosome-binding protein aMBF1 (putative translation factor)
VVAAPWLGEDALNAQGSRGNDHMLRMNHVIWKLLTGAQIRAARALLRWSADELAGAAKIGVATVRRAERTDGKPSMTKANKEAIHRALESAGVEFINEDGGGPGVRLRKKGRKAK